MRSRTEQTLYELFGIKIFRKLILRFEQVKHRSDGEINQNYHLENHGICAMLRFSGYLLFNSLCHVLSIVLAAACTVLKAIFRLHSPLLDICLVLLFSANIYCIALQRYIHLKLQDCVNRRIAVRDRVSEARIRALSHELQGRDIGKREHSLIVEEYDLLQRIWEHVTAGGDCFLSASDAPVLSRIADGVRGIQTVSSRKEEDRSETESLAGIISAFPSKPLVIGRAESWASRLQRWIHVDHRRNTLFGFSIITETQQCESAFRDIFQDDARDAMELMVNVLSKAYGQVLLHRN